MTVENYNFSFCDRVIIRDKFAQFSEGVKWVKMECTETITGSV